MLITSAWVLSAVFSIPTLVLFDVSEGNVTYKGKSITLCEPLFSDKFESQVVLLARFVVVLLEWHGFQHYKVTYIYVLCIVDIHDSHSHCCLHITYSNNHSLLLRYNCRHLSE